VEDVLMGEFLSLVFGSFELDVFLSKLAIKCVNLISQLEYEFALGFEVIGVDVELIFK
jgi:hypothetical protein